MPDQDDKQPEDAIVTDEHPELPSVVGTPTVALPEGYKYGVTRYADLILREAFPERFAQLVEVLEGYRIDLDELTTGGGGRASHTARFDATLAAHGWGKRNISISRLIDGKVIHETPGHEIDMFAELRADDPYPGIGVEMEWNNKDPFYDRDLLNFQALHHEGALAVGVIVTRGPRAWLVTLAIVVLTKLVGCRRTFCANYVIWDEALAVDQPDLFSANQIVHLRPIADDGTFARFVAANPFVRRFYPGFAPSVPLAGFGPGRIARALKGALEVLLAPGPGQILEAASRALYGRYLRAKAAGWRSPEQVLLEPDRLKLHGHSHRRAVLERFEAAVVEVMSAGRGD